MAGSMLSRSVSLCAAGKVVRLIGFTNQSSAPPVPAISAGRPVREIWCGVTNPPTAPADQDGSPGRPYEDSQVALDWCAARKLSTGEDGFIINLSAKSYGDNTIPPDISLDIRSTPGAYWNSLQISGGVSGSVVIIRSAVVATILSFVGSPGQNVTLKLIDSCDIGSDISNPGNVDVSVVVNSRGYDLNNYAAVLRGNCDIGSTGSYLLQNVNIQQKLIGNKIEAIRCKIDSEIINVYDIISSFDSCTFSTAATINFLVNPGTATFDESSAISFGISRGLISNGEPITSGAGVYLARVGGSDFNDCMAAMDSGPGAVKPAGNGAIIGIVSPSAIVGSTALVWPNGSRIPNGTFPSAELYSDIDGLPVKLSSFPPGSVTRRMGIGTPTHLLVQCGGEEIVTA